MHFIRKHTSIFMFTSISSMLTGFALVTICKHLMGAPVSEGFTGLRWGQTFIAAPPCPALRQGRPTPAGERRKLRDKRPVSRIHRLGHLWVPRWEETVRLNGEVWKTWLTHTKTPKTKKTTKRQAVEICQCWNYIWWNGAKGRKW